MRFCFATSESISFCQNVGGPPPDANDGIHNHDAALATKETRKTPRSATDVPKWNYGMWLFDGRAVGADVQRSSRFGNCLWLNDLVRVLPDAWCDCDVTPHFRQCIVVVLVVVLLLLGGYNWLRKEMSIQRRDLGLVHPEKKNKRLPELSTGEKLQRYNSHTIMMEIILSDGLPRLLDNSKLRDSIGCF
mmetsp:Transcript_11638/g.26914  ORF Transcript_11638/g.26914 Transcript_11638/m.26914 type:complete len:189 (-) Transcript_11638:1518-2084(-)